MPVAAVLVPDPELLALQLFRRNNDACALAAEHSFRTCGSHVWRLSLPVLTSPAAELAGSSGVVGPLARTTPGTGVWSGGPRYAGTGVKENEQAPTRIETRPRIGKSANRFRIRQVAEWSGMAACTWSRAKHAQSRGQAFWRRAASRPGCW